MRKTKQHILSVALTALMSLTVALPAMAKPPHANGKAKGHDYSAPAFKTLPAFPQNYMPEERQRLPQWAQQQISYSQAKSIAMRRYPGAQYIDTYLNGNTYTVILLLPNTKKIKVKIDAVSGRIR